MSKFQSNVRFKVNEDNRDAFIGALKTFNPKDFDGAISHQVIDSGNGRFASSIEWENQNALVSVRPDLIKFLDSARHLLEKISPELGLTDPISGEIVIEV